MKNNLVALCLLFFMPLLSLKAQVMDTSLNLPLLIKNSAIRNMELADSFSAIGDSVTASSYYVQIDPYFYVSSGRTPKTIDSSFVNYLLTRQAKEEYRKIFSRAYSKKRTEPYKVLDKMLREDQAVRNKLSSCSDSACRTAAEKEMMKVDSPHFEYLYSYVKKNGWPTYENGAMYAEVIAMHDGKHMKYYLPFIKKSVIEGKSHRRFYYKIMNRAIPSDFEKLNGYKNKVSFDISYVLRGIQASPKQLSDIQKAVVDCGPIIHQYYVYESADKKDYRDFMEHTNDENYWLAWNILASISNAQTGHIDYSFFHAKTNRKGKKLTVYLVY